MDLGDVVDPFEITAEELEERIASVEGATLRAALIEAGVEAPRAKLTVDALLELDSFAQLALAVSVLTEEEVRWALLVLARTFNALTRDAEAFAAWENASADAT